MMEWVLLLVLLGGMLTVMALLDVVRATDLDPTARIIMALALLVVPPIGLLVWLVLRFGRPGVFIATGLFALSVAVVVVVSQATAPRGIQVMEEQGAGFTMQGGAHNAHANPAIP
jgi:hypothetical protein